MRRILQGFLMVLTIVALNGIAAAAWAAGSQPLPPQGQGGGRGGGGGPGGGGPGGGGDTDIAVEVTFATGQGVDSLNQVVHAGRLFDGNSDLDVEPTTNAPLVVDFSAAASERLPLCRNGDDKTNGKDRCSCPFNSLDLPAIDTYTDGIFRIITEDPPDENGESMNADWLALEVGGASYAARAVLFGDRDACTNVRWNPKDNLFNAPGYEFGLPPLETRMVGVTISRTGPEEWVVTTGANVISDGTSSAVAQAIDEPAATSAVDHGVFDLPFTLTVRCANPGCQ